MRIAEVHVYQVDLAVAEGRYRMSMGSYGTVDSTVVRLVSETGLEGWGETCPIGPVYQPEHALGARAALAEMAPALVGAELTGPVALRRLLDTRLDGHHYAKAAVDIAAYDLLGKAYDVRVCDLLGGAVTDRVGSYYSLSVGDPDEVARQAVERLAEGYPRLQLKVGGRPVEEDIATIRAVWEATGCGRLAVDANRSLTTRDALRIDRECADVPLILEQPCRTMEEILAIRAQLRHPVYLDENTDSVNAVVRALATGVCDGFGLKVTRLGGLAPFSTVRDLCDARSMPHTCDDAWGGDIIAAACVHMGATVRPHLLEGVWIAQPLLSDHHDSEHPVRVEGGHIQVPTGPGLGVVPDDGVFGEPVASYA